MESQQVGHYGPKAMFMRSIVQMVHEVNKHMYFLEANVDAKLTTKILMNNVSKLSTQLKSLFDLPYGFEMIASSINFVVA